MKPVTIRLTPTLMAAIAILTAGPAQAGFTCVGTEPFWRMTVNRGIKLEELNSGTTRYPKAQLNRFGTTWAYTAPGRAPTRAPISIAIRRSQCSDGMSDRTYPYDGTVSVKGKATLRGCCTKW